MACEKEVHVGHVEIARYQCDVHEKDLMPLLCKDCDCPVCLDCLTTNHIGHKMGKLSECIDDKLDQLNDVVHKNDSACFDVKEIEEILHKRQQEVNKHVKEMVQQVLDREEEMLKDVKNVCQKTIDQITNRAKEIKNPMVQDENFLCSFKSCKLFGKESDENCIKCFYFYNKLKNLGQTYVTLDQEYVPFTLVTRDFSTEKIFELAGSIVTDEQSSSDENLEQKYDTPTNPHEANSICKNETKAHQYKKKLTEGAIDSIISISDDRRILRSKHVLYHQFDTDNETLVDNMEHFTYASETNEILVILKGTTQIYRGSASTKEQLLPFVRFDCNAVVCIGHNAAAYLLVVLKSIHYVTEKPFYSICKLDDTGCLTEPVRDIDSPDVKKGRITVQRTSFVIIASKKIFVMKTLTFERLFWYAGRIGNSPSSTFSPVDVCTDPDGNYLVIDSFDNTMHLLDPKGKFLRIIMSAEDGLSGITCIAMDIFGWVLVGCKDGMVHFVNYQHFKSTTRKERCLQKQKTMEATARLETDKIPDTFELQEPNTRTDQTTNQSTY